MLPAVEQLLVLQDRDRKLRALQQELKALPLERTQLESRLASAQAQFEAVKLQGKELEVERKKLEIEAQSKRDQITKYQTQKFQTRKNEEFAAFSTAIEHLETDISRIEDRELDLMQSAEDLKARVAESDAASRAAKSSVTSQLQDLETKEAELRRQLQEVEGERRRFAQEVEEELLDTYERIFATRGNAVVPLEHEVCTGCHMKVTASTNASVRARKSIVHCEQCGRILYPGES